MKKILGSVYLRAFLSRIVPFFISFFLVDPETKAYIVPFWAFMLIMILVLIGVLFFAKKYLIAGKWTNTASIFLGMNVLLDMVVLIGLFKMPLNTWLMTVLPVYIILFYGFFFINRNK